MVYLGKHLIMSTSTTQAIVSLSSGESEFYAAVKGASVGLGSIHMAQDMGVEIRRPLDLRLDATAGLGIASRRGVGRIRHIATLSLWLQRAVHEGKVSLTKIPGKENPADLGTKYLDRADIERCWKAMGFVLLTGGSKLALRAQ